MKKNIYYFAAVCITLFTQTNLWANPSTNAWGLSCPKDVTVDCGAELWDLSIYGNATIHDHTGYRNAGEPQMLKNIDGCGNGTITRTWTVEDAYWRIHSCSQIIKIGSGSTFNASHITWPQMAVLEGCNPDISPEALGKPTWLSGNCDLIGSTYKDQVFTVSPDCKKIMRKWTVMNWCGSNTNYHPNSWTYTQVIKISSNTPPPLTCPNPIVAHSTDCNFGIVNAPSLAIDKSICGGNYDITNNSTFATNKGANLSGKYPIGTTTVTYTVKYGCGDKKSCNVNVTVKNNNAPAPICLAKMSVALMGIDTDKDGTNDEGMATLWAKDVDYKSYATCNASPLTFSFRADSIVMSKTYTCNEIGLNKEKIYINDKFGGQSACAVEIDIQNNGANIKDCKPAPDTTKLLLTASGKISNVYGESVKEVNIELTAPSQKYNYITKYDTLTEFRMVDSFINWSGNKLYIYDHVKTIKSKIDTIVNPNYILSSTSDENGLYSFNSLLKRNVSYIVNSSKMQANPSLIDKGDLRALEKFIENKGAFTHDYQYIAADVDHSGVIDSSDLLLLKSYIDGELSSFGNDVTAIAYQEEAPKLNAAILQNHNAWHKIDNVKRDFEALNFLIVQLGDIDTQSYNEDSIELVNKSSDTRSRPFTELTASAHPNPFISHIQFNIEGVEGEVVLEIYNLAGKKMDKQVWNLSSGVNKIDYDGSLLHHGAYLYTLHQGISVKRGMVIKGE